MSLIPTLTPTLMHSDIDYCLFVVGMSLDEANDMMTSDPDEFKDAVQKSLIRHLAAVQSLRKTDDLLFFDYGNAFLLECHRAGCDVDTEIPSYVGE